MTASENQIVVYQPNETVRLDVRLENETVWLTQSQMATLFGCSSDNVGLHLKNVYAAGELVRESTTEEFSVVRMEGSRQVRRTVTCYNLDAIISVGHRVDGMRGRLSCRSSRNPSIAKVLYLRKAIEMWGRGIGLIVDACKMAHFLPPKIYEDRGFIYTVFTRPTAQEWKNKVGDGFPAIVASVPTTDTPLSATDKADPATNATSTVTYGERVAHLLAAFGELVQTKVGIGRLFDG